MEAGKNPLAGVGGQTQEALGHLLAARELEPRVAEVWNNLSKLFWKLERFDEAQASAYRSLDVQPINAEAWACLGMIYSSRKDLAMAERAFHRAVEIDADGAKFHWNLAGVYQLQGRWQESLVHLDWVLAAVGRLEEAQQAREKASKLQGSTQAR